MRPTSRRGRSSPASGIACSSSASAPTSWSTAATISDRKKAGKDLKSLPANATDEQAREVFAGVGDSLLKLSKCPDFVVNRGHYFRSEKGRQGFEVSARQCDRRAGAGGLRRRRG